MSNVLPVAVLGGGAWGVALAAAAARGKSDVVLYTRRDTKESLPEGVRVVRDIGEAAKHARLILVAVPTAVCRSVARALGEHIDGSHYVVHGVRGLEGESLEAVSDVLREETAARRVGALGGPALAQDLLAGKPSVIVTGSHFPEVNEAVTTAIGSPTLRVYPTHDLRGLEWASALVGCLTLAIGYAQATRTSPGLIAALISRSIGEASRIAEAAGGEERTLLGLAGYGDLLASIAQTERPEVLIGTALARGATLDDAMQAGGLRSESVDLIPRVSSWASARGVRAPIFRALERSILEGRKTSAILEELMTLPIERHA